MMIRRHNRAAIYGAFYEYGKRITDLEDKVISCVLLDLEGVEVLTLEDITTAEDGSVCVIIEPNTLPVGRYFYHVTLKGADGDAISEIKNEIEVIGYE